MYFNSVEREHTCNHNFRIKLCKTKATGLDKISDKLLRYCPELLTEAIEVYRYFLDYIFRRYIFQID